jgi:hypothetical protein
LTGILGSYTHHDILPWDDDADLRVRLADRDRLLRLISSELKDVVAVSSVSDHYGHYDKFYFPWTPRAGKRPWSYPFVEIFYYDENATHIWRAQSAQESIEACAASKADIFPTVWRPLGEIWLSVSSLDSVVPIHL